MTTEAVSQELAVRGPDSMLSIIERAVMSPDFDVNKLTQLLELRERWEKTEARKAFVAAMNEFKKSPPIITKNKEVSFGNTHYNHATLDHVCDVVISGLSKHGISHRWTVAQDAGLIKVTCILTHEQGHSEETTLMGAPDASGAKNSIQQIGSTVTYLQRYTLLAATGLAASNDSDGVQANNGGLNVDEHCEWIANAKDLSELKRLYDTAKKAALDAKNSAALQRLAAAKDAKKKEFI